MGSPEEVKADEYNVLYVGHSFGHLAITLQDLAHASGFEDHAQYISERSARVPPMARADNGHRENIKAYLTRVKSMSHHDLLFH